MKRQNPPEACIERAENIEKYLSPTSIGVIYGTAAIAYAIAISLVFGAIVATGIVAATTTTVLVFALIGMIPAVFIVLAAFLRPNDPVSRYIQEAANSCRRPMPVAADDSTFKLRLMDGEQLCVKLSFIYPPHYRSAGLKEQLYTVVHGALCQDFSQRTITPTAKEIEETLHKPLSLLAEEFDIPVLYSEIREVFYARDEALAPVAYAQTGTWS